MPSRWCRWRKSRLRWSRTPHWPPGAGKRSHGAAAHYVLRKDGHVAQTIRELDVGFHAGNREYNERSIGIEHEGFVDRPEGFTDEMLSASAQLTARICARHKIPVDRKHIIEQRGGGNLRAGAGTLDHQWLAAISIRPDRHAVVGARAPGERMVGGQRFQSHPCSHLAFLGSFEPRDESQFLAALVRLRVALAQRGVEQRECGVDLVLRLGRESWRHQRSDFDLVRVQFDSRRARQDQQFAAHVLT